MRTTGHWKPGGHNQSCQKLHPLKLQGTCSVGVGVVLPGQTGKQSGLGQANKIGCTTHAGAVARGAEMAGHKAGRNLRRRHHRGSGAFSGDSRAVAVPRRRKKAFGTLDQPGPGRTGAGDRTRAPRGVWEFGEFGPLAVLEDCRGRARVGDSDGGRGLGRLGSFEHAA